MNFLVGCWALFRLLWTDWGTRARPWRTPNRRGWFVITIFVLTLGATARAHCQTPEPDLSMPAWDLCVAADRTQMACFTQAEVQQLLRLQEHARYGLRLASLHQAIETRMVALTAELEAAGRSYASLQAVIEARNVDLSADLAEARSEAERYRSRAERRRIWPWVALGFGVLAGGLLGGLVGH